MAEITHGYEHSSQLYCPDDLPQGMRYMTDDELDRYERQVAESEGFDVDYFPGAVDFIIRPVRLQYRSPETLRMIGYFVYKAVQLYNAGNSTKKICSPRARIVKVNEEISRCPMTYYITFAVDDEDAASPGHAEPKVYQAKAFWRFSYTDDSVVQFCRRKESNNHDINNKISCHENTSFVKSDVGEVEMMLEHVDKLVEEGKEAFRNGDFDTATECFSIALELKVAHYGRKAPQCATLYYWYGRAILFKARKEADPWRIGFLKASEKKIKLARQMFDTARGIVDECSSETMQKALLLLDLARIALEMDDSETSSSDCCKALSTLRNLVERCRKQQDNGQIAEAYFQMCLCSEICSNPFEAALHCQNAISICRSYLRSLKVGADFRSEKAPYLDKKAEMARLSERRGRFEWKYEHLQQRIRSSDPVLDIVKILRRMLLKAAMENRASYGSATAMVYPIRRSEPTAAREGHHGVAGKGMKRFLVTLRALEWTPRKKRRVD